MLRVRRQSSYPQGAQSRRLGRLKGEPMSTRLLLLEREKGRGNTGVYEGGDEQFGNDV